MEATKRMIYREIKEYESELASLVNRIQGGPTDIRDQYGSALPNVSYRPIGYKRSAIIRIVEVANEILNLMDEYEKAKK